jgi:nucleoside-diphosphate-sugar epimerase
MSKALFIGGPGNLSTSCVRELLVKGYEVAILTLPESPDEGLSDKVTFSRGDRNEQAQIEAAVQTFKPDVILDFVCFEPWQAEQAAKAARGRVSQYIFVSTVDVYGYPLSHLPMRESDPWNPPNCKYAADKLACEEVFRTHSAQGDFALTVVRPAYSFGKNFVISFFTREGGRDLIPRLREGRPVLIPGDGTTLLHASVAYNTGRMIAQLAGAPVAEGKSYTCGHHSVTTHEGYVRLFAAAVGVEPNLAYVPTTLIRGMDTPEVNELLLWDVTGYNLFYSVDQFRNDFPDFVWEQTLEQAAQEYVEYNDGTGLFRTSEPEILEDRIVTAYQACLEGFEV